MSIVMTEGSQQFAAKKFVEIKGSRMAYIDEGEGASIVFQHGNPTSSYLWRNIMPACRGLGRLIACDLIGMGDSAKLTGSGPGRYTYAEHREFLFALWEELKLGDEVVLVIHDWGSALGFDWANQHRNRVQGIAYMEAAVMPLEWSDFTPAAEQTFKTFRSPAGDALVLTDNVFVEQILPSSIMRRLSDVEMSEYRRPFLEPGEDRRPTLAWPREIPIAGEPADVVEVFAQFGSWLAESPVPKLYIQSEPGARDTGRARDICRKWPNQTEVSVPGLHFLQEDSPKEISDAVSEFVRRLRP